VNTVERTALLEGLQLHDELRATVDERTLQILDRRRRTATVHRRGWLVRRLLLVADLVGLAGAFLLAEWIVTKATASGVLGVRGEVLAFFATLPGWVVVAKLYGLYDRDEERTDHSTTDDFAGVFHMVTVCTWLFWALSRATAWFQPTASKLLIFWSAAVIFVSVGRAGARALARRNVAYLQNTFVVGAGDVGQLFDVERVIVAFSNESHQQTLELLRSLKDLDVQIDIVPRLFEIVGSGFEIHTVEGLPLVGMPPLRLARSSRLLKRVMDLALSALALVLLAPLFVLVSVLIKLDTPGPVFFRQVRMGYGERPFRIFKFRSMYVDADERKHEVAHLNKYLKPGDDPRMFKIADDPRITRVGRVLRRFSLDELPQLLNVLVGQMSLVGPRPLILSEDEQVSEWGRQRLNLKPGVTGPWQVLGRNGIPFAEMVSLDYLYVTSWSLVGDLKLIGRTIPVILRGEGA
jgi:lipopolysaccharide/colanic/teichoic acid biosynthesis glycosyltransferase